MQTLLWRVMRIRAVLAIVALLILAACTPAEDPAQLYLLGNSYAQQGYYDRAIASYERSVSLKPDSIVYNAIGNHYIDIGNFTQAEDAFKNGIKTDPDDPENYYDLGLHFIRNGDNDAAEEQLLALVQKAPDSAPGYDLLGTVYIEEQEWDKAERALKTSLKLRERAETHNDLGVVYWNTNRTAKAVEHYRKALALNPGYDLAKNNLDDAVARNASLVG